MTPAARARFEEVMARKIYDYEWGKGSYDSVITSDFERSEVCMTVRAAIDAELAAGFVISEGDDGR